MANTKNKVFEGKVYYAQVFSNNYDKGGNYETSDGREIEIPARYKVLFEFDPQHVVTKGGKTYLVDLEGEKATYALKQPITLKSKKGETWDLGIHAEFTSKVYKENGDKNQPPRVTDDHGNEWPGSRFRADETPLYIGNGSEAKISIYEHMWGKNNDKIKPILNRLVITNLVQVEVGDQLTDGEGFDLNSLGKAKAPETKKEIQEDKSDISADEFFSDEPDEE
jgi:hypothetical protein